MSASENARESTYSDTEATLRQVDEVLNDFEGGGSRGKIQRVLDSMGERPTGLKDLVEILEAAYGEVVSIIDSLRKSRGLLEKAAMERLQSTHAKLAEVSSATEMAATGMLDGLDRSLVLVDKLEAASEDKEAAEGEKAAPEIRDEIREELHALIGLLQFQDITSQQLGYASGVLLDIEERMVRIAEVFDFRTGEERETGPDGEDHSDMKGRDKANGNGAGKDFDVCDPEASHFDADSRQALADEIFK